ncbi:YqhG family protein [Domibacillus mangrovi]|uniref:Uncharacterized protein n=1 Tax=Domibacillus mangrovi TaxID=1714354 RepID=A0A1Q5P746_9BACI|nr:YqhG family protein [Domibacillus mangrovi]OKL38095.1 hypothetical protein BLL40_01335 [Domibacillus mangrovi]
MMTFLKQFFTACNCHITHQNDESITVELSEQVDRAIMNRPFYWHYKDQLNEKGTPMTVSFYVKDTGQPLRAHEEYISFGSPRFHQLLHYAGQQSLFIRLYEECSSVKPLQLEPWLFVHFLISYEANGKKERIESLALHLISGKIQRDFLTKISDVPFAQTIPSFHYVLSPFITPISGLKRIQKMIMNELNQENHEWAKEAKNKQEKEISLLRSFYKNNSDNSDEYTREKEAIIRRFEPVIRLSVWNGGLLYLSAGRCQSFTDAQSVL